MHIPRNMHSILDFRMHIAGIYRFPGRFRIHIQLNMYSILTFCIHILCHPSIAK